MSNKFYSETLSELRKELASLEPRRQAIVKAIEGLEALIVNSDQLEVTKPAKATEGQSLLSSLEDVKRDTIIFDEGGFDGRGKCEIH